MGKKKFKIYALDTWIIFGYYFEQLICKKDRKIELAGFLGGWGGGPHCLAYRILILVHPPKIKPMPPSVKVQSPKSLDCQEIPCVLF